MKLWIDDIRPAPEGWYQARSVNVAKEIIIDNYPNIEILSIDHDSGDYNRFGGDYVNLLKWLEEEEHRLNKRFVTFPIHIHSMNPVGVQNMRGIIQHNNWTEVNSY
mgnify:FL=1